MQHDLLEGRQAVNKNITKCWAQLRCPVLQPISRPAIIKSDFPILDIPHLMVYTPVSINNDGRRAMQTAKIFINGRSQAVRLPKDFRFSGNDVFIKKIGKMVVLLPKDDPWSSLFKSLDQFTDDFMDSRDQPDQDSREKL
jgi:antitoxin VapB